MSPRTTAEADCHGMNREDPVRVACRVAHTCAHGACCTAVLVRHIGTGEIFRPQEYSVLPAVEDICVQRRYEVMLWSPAASSRAASSALFFQRVTAGRGRNAREEGGRVALS